MIWVYLPDRLCKNPTCHSRSDSNFHLNFHLRSLFNKKLPSIYVHWLSLSLSLHSLLKVLASSKIISMYSWVYPSNFIAVPFEIVFGNVTSCSSQSVMTQFHYHFVNLHSPFYSQFLDSFPEVSFKMIGLFLTSLNRSQFNASISSSAKFSRLSPSFPRFPQVTLKSTAFV